jgi:hypothetical protein
MNSNTRETGQQGTDSVRGTASALGRSSRLVLTAAVVVGLIATAAAPAAAAQDDSGTEQSLVVDVHQDGSASVTLTLTYDLTSQNETDAFESLRGDDAAQTEFRDRFRDRMAAVAADAQKQTGREMSVLDASISLTTTDSGDTGVVELSVVYEGLAAVESDQLVVTEPFASGYVTNYAFVVRAPDGYALADVTPSPASQQDAVATWAQHTDLSDFEATFTAQKSTTSDGGDGVQNESGGGAPGFGVLATLAAIGAALAVRARR